MSKLTRKKMMIEEIIEKQQIEIFFQPIVSIRTKKVFALEALTRCSYKDENIRPDILFKMAKDEGLASQLDTLTREMAIRKFYKYYKKDNDIMLFLNFESSMINNFELISNSKDFIDVIDELPIPYENFTLEIKEDEITNTKSLKSFCKTYKKMGFSIALDDFGTGSSTFDRINLIKPDLIKIDKSLFDKLKNNQINKEIIKSIAKMSHNLGIRVLAEGVEEEDSICISLRATINLFQGYYFCKPENVLDEKKLDEILLKIIDIGKLFKSKTISSMNKKRASINKYNLIAHDITKQINNLQMANTAMAKEFIKYSDIEAIYLIDADSAKQIHETIIIKNINGQFRPTKDGDEHYLKEYYYITLESKQGIFLSQKYISYASGNICKTFAKKFKLNDKNYILCLDIVLEKGIK